MRKLLVLLGVLVLLLALDHGTNEPKHLEAPAPVKLEAETRRIVSPVIMQRTVKVMKCEGGNWHANGSLYQGGLGWLHSTWLRFKAPTFPDNMAQATPQQQAWAMAHFVGAVLHYWPHQDYPFQCGGGY